MCYEFGELIFGGAYFRNFTVCVRGNICQYNLEKGELLYQKAQKKFRAPGENQTLDPPSSSSGALTTKLIEALW